MTKSYIAVYIDPLLPHLLGPATEGQLCAKRLLGCRESGGVNEVCCQLGYSKRCAAENGVDIARPTKYKQTRTGRRRGIW